MKLSELIEELSDLQAEHGDHDVVMYDTEVGNTMAIEAVAFYKRTDYHGAVLELDEDAVALLPFDEWDDEEDDPD